MEKFFISDLTIKKVRHLKDITIHLSEEEIKHLIFTGRNGSGKTSVLDFISNYLNTITTLDIKSYDDSLKYNKERLNELQTNGIQNGEVLELERQIKYFEEELDSVNNRIFVQFNKPIDTLRYYFEKGRFILAYYKAERLFEAEIPKYIEKVELKSNYTISETPRQLFVKYLVDLKVTEALSRNNGKYEKADMIKQWFIKFQELLRKIFDDKSLELIFEEDNFSFLIKEKNRNVFDFNNLASGFAAVLDIIVDIIMRMEKNTNKSFDFNMSGIVLIDEIETHLHIDLQKTILNLLTTVFPNIQFIMSTHSPFILNSLQNVVIYDLENNTLVKNGLSNVPYSGIVEGYFNSSEMSVSLQQKFERYKELVQRKDFSDNDFEEIAELEMFLNEIPDYLALNITTEYQRLKTEFENREDI